MHTMRRKADLIQAYFTVLGNHQTSANLVRSTAQKNISDIVHLHDDILGELHRRVPFAEYDQRTSKVPPHSTSTRTHARWHSVDVVPTRSPPTLSKLASIRKARRSLNISRSSGDGETILTCSPHIVAVVAKTFSNYVGCGTAIPPCHIDKKLNLFCHR